MNEYHKESDLVNRVNSALGPAQKLVALKELSQVYKDESKDSLKIQEKYLETLHKCLEISNADPALWFEFGNASYSLNRIPLALYAYQAASTLDPSPLNLYSYSLCLALTHDYINALSIANYLIETYSYADAIKIKNHVNFRMTGLGQDPGLSNVSWAESTESPKTGIRKISNLYGLCKSVRHLANNKDGDLYIFEKAEPGKYDSSLTKKKKDLLIQSPECKYWDLVEKYKIKVLRDCESLCFGFVSPKLFQKVFETTKATAVFECEIKQFLGVPMNYRKLGYELIHLLCSNSPRPSVLLSGEVSGEIMKIYILCSDFLPLQDEYLTLLEISIKEAKPDVILDLRNRLIQTYQAKPELNLRCYVSIAQSFFKTRTKFEKNQDFLVQQLCNADLYLDKALQLISDNSLYLWWSDSFITTQELLKLKTDIQIDYEILQIDKEIKATSRLASSALGLLERLTKILAHSHKCDDPVFYWKKVKNIVKGLGRFALGPIEHESIGMSLGRYVAVLLYNLEDGVKLTNDHDIKGLLAVLTENINYADLANGTRAQLIGSVVNLLKHCSKNFHQFPFFFKKVFKTQDPQYLVVIFEDFHRILFKMQKHSDAKFHLQLCKAFEKSCFLYAPSLCKVIYSWMYGLGARKCTCKANFPTTILILPNSSVKLSRVLSYLHYKWEEEADLQVNPQVLALLKELYSKEPRFFVGCKHTESRNIQELLGISEIHTGCCPEAPREIAKRGYKRFGLEIIANSIKGDLKEAMKLLKSASDILIQALYLDPSDFEVWGLFGILYMWKWIIGYFDTHYTFDNLQASESDLQMSHICFEKAIQTTSQSLKNYCLEAKAILLYLQVVNDKTQLDKALSMLPDINTPRSRFIYAKLKRLSKQEISDDLLIEKQAFYLKVLYEKYKNEETLKELEGLTDPFALYYVAKIKGNWIEKLSGGFLSSKAAENDVFLNRPCFLWKLKRKVGEKCLDLFKAEKNITGIQLTISRYSGLCGRGRKNKEITRVIGKAIKILFDLGQVDLSFAELEKNSALNLKEKQLLREELVQENNVNPL